MTRPVIMATPGCQAPVAQRLLRCLLFQCSRDSILTISNYWCCLKVLQYEHILVRECVMGSP